ncbi:MAG: glycosyltransferase [Patescibacteria group bacterium]
MKKNKILILHGQPGMGHLITAKALVEVFSKKYPEVEIKDADAFDFLYGPLRHGYLFFYNHIVAKAPFVFKIFYNSYNNKLIQKFLERITLFFVKKGKFIFFIKDFAPDFILATNPLPLQLASLIEEKKVIDILSANVCTDFGFHSLWHSPDINYYFVANEEIKKSLLDHKVNLDKIKTTGIPVRPIFNQLLDRQKILESLNFNFSQPVLLIIGGQLKYKELLRVILGIKEKNSLAQFIVIAGRDKNLQKKLENSELKKNANVRVFGLVNDIEKFMTASDLILSKAGGSTTAECLVKALPMIVYKTIPGQEEDNVNYLVNNKAGIKVKNTRETIEAVIDLFSQPDKLAKMKESCIKIQKPNASEDIADFVISQIK